MRWPWQRRKQHPPREGWLVLTDAEGRPVSEQIPVVVNCDPLKFEVEHSLTFRQIEASHVQHVRVTDADGNVVEVPLYG